ncbi:UNVERIFIED_CONTAM: hypothetical protein HDU68_004316 [Siphonaria sp. JEL0065]|nr:hypothetical protein HDU68_004316 [Siphonaria sp. JEL0065]
MSFLRSWLTSTTSSPSANGSGSVNRPASVSPVPSNVQVNTARPRSLSHSSPLVHSDRDLTLNRASSPSRLAALASSVKGLFQSSSSTLSPKSEIELSSNETEPKDLVEQPANPPSLSNNSNRKSKTPSSPVLSKINVTSSTSNSINALQSPSASSSSSTDSSIELEHRSFSLVRMLTPISNLILNPDSPSSTPTPPDLEQQEDHEENASEESSRFEVVNHSAAATATPTVSTISPNNFSSSPLSRIAFADTASSGSAIESSDDTSLSESSVLLSNAPSESVVDTITVEQTLSNSGDIIASVDEHVDTFAISVEIADSNDSLPDVRSAAKADDPSHANVIAVLESNSDSIESTVIESTAVIEYTPQQVDDCSHSVPTSHTAPIIVDVSDAIIISSSSASSASSVLFGALEPSQESTLVSQMNTQIIEPFNNVSDNQESAFIPPTPSSSHIDEKVVSNSVQDAMETSLSFPAPEAPSSSDASLSSANDDIATAAESTTTIIDVHNTSAKMTTTAIEATGTTAVNSAKVFVPSLQTSPPTSPSTSASTITIKPLSFRPKPSPEERKRLTKTALEKCRSHFFPTSPEHSPMTTTQQADPQFDQMTLSVISTASNSSLMTTSTPASTAASKQFARSREFGDVVVVTGLPRHVGFAVHKRIVERGWMQVGALKEATGSGDEGSIDESLDGRKKEEEDVVGWDGFESHVYQHLNPDIEALVFDLLKPSSRDYIVASDFKIVVEDILQTHSAFEFLASSPAFQARFTETVIARLFYLYPRNGRDRMTLREFRLTGITQLFHKVESATNSLGTNIPSVFSYKDFYVIYCKFWELDRDRDMLLTIYDLELYGRRALSHAALARIIECYGVNVRDGVVVEGAVARRATAEGSTGVRCLGYKEFIAFIISAEEKTSDSALDYWFRILDLDGDGVLSMLELETFWEHQHMRLPEQYSVFDFFSLILDLIRPSATSLTLKDLKRNRLASGLFLDLLLDSRKHVENIRRSTDVGFRLRDEIWTEEEEAVAAARREQERQQQVQEQQRLEQEDGDVGVDLLADLENAVRRYKLEGWAKFSERAYRELSAPVETDSTDEVEAEEEEPVIDNSPSLQTANMNL